ncbi:hypothetical protein C3L33_01467, partial [Rhododendron williamsianum]
MSCCNVVESQISSIGSYFDDLWTEKKDAPYDVYRTERGGEVTYHGPGQLVMYPILNLRYHEMDLHWYFRALEEVVIRVLFSTFSIKASRVEGMTGVWVDSSMWDTRPWCWKHKGLLREHSLSKGAGMHHMEDSQLLDITHKSLVKEFSEVFQVELQQKAISELEFSKG